MILYYLATGLIWFLAYLIGSIPTGYLLSKYYFGIDIREHGSGNGGATNVARVLGKRYFLLILIFDVLKTYFGLVVCSLCLQMLHIPSTELVTYGSAIALLAGNAYSIFLRTFTGKGVATSIGIILYIASWQFVLLFAVCWLVVLVWSKEAFIASLVSISVITAFHAYFFFNTQTLFFLGMLMWVLVRHVSNIRVWYNKKSI